MWMTSVASRPLRRRTRALRRQCGAESELGSTIPLILGFFVIAMLVVGGSVAAADAYLDQRALQSVCDGAALAGVNALDDAAVFDDDFGGYGDLPLGDVDAAVAQYLGRDAGRSDVQIESLIVTGDATVELVCVQRLPLVFGEAFGYGDGVEHRVAAAARSNLR